MGEAALKGTRSNTVGLVTFEVDRRRGEVVEHYLPQL